MDAEHQHCCRDLRVVILSGFDGIHPLSSASGRCGRGGGAGVDSNRVKRLVGDERDGVAQYGEDPGLDIGLARMLFVANAPRAVFRCTRLRGGDSTSSSDAIFYPTTCY